MSADPAKQYLDKAWSEILAGKATDADAWRVAAYAIGSTDPTCRDLGQLIMREIVRQRPAIREVALAFQECSAMREQSPLPKFIRVLGYAELLGYQPLASGDQMSHQERIEKLGRLDSAAATFTENAFGGKGLDSQVYALVVVFRAATLRAEDRAWALAIVSKQIGKVSGEEKRFWRVAHEAITSRLEE